MQPKLSDHNLLYLPDGTPIFEEYVLEPEAWHRRPQEERDQLMKLLHDYAAGEGWDQEDPWPEVPLPR